ncbi:MAG TPA: T9SS type A sorting domain-containing protein, partial [Bacteroidetes bacterium]|nr:T9SS type A sorting domain-containing protein [Bacteroidota bacterium]
TAQKEGRSVALNWLSNTGNINDYFEVQHAVDGVNYQVISKIDNQSNSSFEMSYHFKHDAPESGNNYYRIKQQYKDGGFIYSNSQLIIFEMDMDSFHVFPNPSDAAVFVNLRKHIGKQLKLELYSLLGKRILEKEMESIPAHPIPLDLSQQDNGIYILFIKIKGKPSFSQKIILNRTY